MRLRLEQLRSAQRQQASSAQLRWLLAQLQWQQPSEQQRLAQQPSVQQPSAQGQQLSGQVLAAWQASAVQRLAHPATH